MDLISIESQQEMDFLGKNMARAGVREMQSGTSRLRPG